MLGAKEREDHSIEIVGLKDAFRLRADLWNTLNNRQKVSVNLLTDKLLRIENVEGKDIIVMDVPRADRTSRPVYCGIDPRPAVIGVTVRGIITAHWRRCRPCSGMLLSFLRMRK